MPTTTHSDPQPCQLVIFGASGDLTRRKLVPALFDLYREGRLPGQFAVLGVSRTPMSDQQFADHLEPGVRASLGDRFDEPHWRDFRTRGLLHYHAGDSTTSADFPPLIARMRQVAGHHGTGENALFYLSVAPHLYEPTIVNLGANSMVTEGKAWCSLDRENRPFQRLIIEKPFGSDLASAEHLNRVLGRVFEEENIYRIDHYLGKETVQNLLVFRFANAIFEPVWNRQYIDHVQITAAETVGVETRGGYYDSSSGGALRDMIQSHLLQVLALVAMEPPVSMAAEDIRGEKAKVLSATHVPPAEGSIERVVVRGQYAPGSVRGEAVSGYREEKGVDPTSRVETYAAVKLAVDNWRWQGVPFYLRSGKRMAKKTTEVVVTFKPTPQCLFRERTRGPDCLPPNKIVINLQPNEGIRLRFEGKVPGHGMQIKSVVMDFNYAQQFHAEPPEAYTTLLLDAFRGDQTLYKDRHEVERAWRIVQPVLEAWARDTRCEIPAYPAGSWGPPEADQLLAADFRGRVWRNG